MSYDMILCKVRILTIYQENGL